jgi:TrpR-related protein YerC/YecD
VDECYAYFEDLCTVKELQDMAQRLDTAIALSEGTSYQTITRQVGISTATIGRVSRALNYGTGGYRTAIERLAGQEET